MELFRLLSVRPGVTSLIGGGGKTTALYVLARELRERGTVICTTTTHIFPPAHMDIAEDASALAAALKRRGCVCAGSRAGEKLAAPPVPMAALAALADYVLVEADGSRGLPVKAHLPHEPAVPPESGQTIVLAGASAFGRPIREAAHRPEQFCRLTGQPPDAPVTARTLAAALRREGLGDKVFINQAEEPAALEEARRLAAALPWPVFAGSLQGGVWICLS